MQLFLSMAEFLIANLALLALALVSSAAWLKGGRALNLLGVLFFYILFISLAVFVFGCTGWLNAHVMAVAGLVVLGWCLIRGWSLLMAEIGRLKETTVLFHRELLRHPALLVFFYGFSAWFVVRSVIHVLVLPPYIWDVLTYHLPKVAVWVQQGSLDCPDTPVVRSFWPAGFELLQAWFALFWHGDAIIEVPGLLFYGLACGSVYVLCRTCGAGVPYSIMGMLFYAATPALVLHSTCGKNDIGVSALFLFVASLASSGRERNTSWMPISLLAILLAVGIKAYMIFLLPGLVVLAWPALLAWKRNHRGAWSVSMPFAVLILFTTAAGSYWYIRNLVAFGNPFYPAVFKLFGSGMGLQGFEDVQQGSFSLKSLWVILSCLFRERILDPGILTPNMPGQAGWGWFAVSIGLPCAVVGLWVRSNYRWLFSGFVLAGLSLMAWITPDLWCLRFFFWFPALLTVGSIVTLSRIHHLAIRHSVLVIGVVATLLNASAVSSNGYHRMDVWCRMAALPLKERSAAILMGGAWESFLNNLPRDKKCVYFTHGDGSTYPLYDVDFSRHLEYLPFELNMDLADTMRKNGAEYLFVWDLDRDWAKWLKRFVDEGGLEDLEYGLYRLKDDMK